MPTRLVSGVKATGSPHIGNYFGAIRQMVSLQVAHECYIFVADLHALNSVHDAAALRQGTVEVVTTYLAAGIDPSRTALFLQSAVPAHAELAQIFGSITSLGMLERAHAYKDAVAKGKEANLGLFAYPVLMAADILLYKPDVVPVGKDQQQHIEIAADLAGRFNHLFGRTFSEPHGIIPADVATVPGLDGQKMSKSYGNTVGLFDATDVVNERVMKIATNSQRPEEPKEADTLLALHRLLGAADLSEVETAYEQGGMGYREIKERLAVNLNAFLEPFRQKRLELDADPAVITRILADGAERASLVANATLKEVKERVGLLA